MKENILKEMFGYALVEVPALNRVSEGPLDDVNKQLSGARSVFGGGQRSKPPEDLKGVQGQLDGSRSVFKKEAATGAQGITLNGDPESLDALMQCLQEAEHAADDPDVAHWAGRAWKAVAAGIRGDGSVTLPKFDKTPEDLMPDEEPGDEGDF